MITLLVFYEPVINHLGESTSILKYIYLQIVFAVKPSLLMHHALKNWESKIYLFINLRCQMPSTGIGTN